ncbi:hypothetical protein VTI28DRAFT_8790 [Corynascus sepedonium]
MATHSIVVTKPESKVPCIVDPLMWCASPLAVQEGWRMAQFHGQDWLIRPRQLPRLFTNGSNTLKLLLGAGQVGGQLGPFPLASLLMVGRTRRPPGTAEPRHAPLGD